MELTQEQILLIRIFKSMKNDKINALGMLMELDSPDKVKALVDWIADRWETNRPTPQMILNKAPQIAAEM